MFLSPLSPLCNATFPHALESPRLLPAPNPILESQVMQSYSLLPRIPILMLLEVQRALNPSSLQLDCKEACEPISCFHVLRPSEVPRYCPSAISEYRELACLLMAMNLICWPILIPRQTFEKDVFQ